MWPPQLQHRPGAFLSCWPIKFLLSNFIFPQWLADCIHLFSKQFTTQTKSLAEIILAAWHHADPALPSFSKWHKQSDLFQHLGSVRSWPLFSPARRTPRASEESLDEASMFQHCLSITASTCGTVSETCLERIRSIQRWFKACLVIWFSFLSFCNCGKWEK